MLSRYHELWLLLIEADLWSTLSRLLLLKWIVVYDRCRTGQEMRARRDLALIADERRHELWLDRLRLLHHDRTSLITHIH